MTTSKLIHGYEVVIGFETHAQLATQSKIFSRAPTAFGAEPNTQACAVDLALPGTLPVMNREAVACAIRLGLALGSREHLRAQELLLSRPAQGLPDQPVRDPGGAGRRGVVLSRRREEDRAPGARPPGGRRGQVAARGFHRPVGHRPEPCRHAAAGDRDRARHPQQRGGRGLCPRAAQDRDLDRHLRRQHAGRLLPLRRQRLRAQARGRRWARAARSRT